MFHFKPSFQVFAEIFKSSFFQDNKQIAEIMISIEIFTNISGNGIMLSFGGIMCSDEHCTDSWKSGNAPKNKQKLLTNQNFEAWKLHSEVAFF